MTSILESGEQGKVVPITTVCERPEAFDGVAARAIMV